VSEGTTLQQELPEAGWFADPADHRMQRYWGGKNWTDHVRYADANSQPISQAPAPTTPLHNDYESIPTTGSTLITQPEQFTRSAEPEQAHQFVAEEPRALAAQPNHSAYRFGQTPSFADDSAFNFAPNPDYTPTTGPTSVVSARNDFNPEPEAMPYVPLSTLRTSSHTYTPAWQQRVSTPSTGAVWLIAFFPAISVAFQLGVLLFAPQLATPAFRVGTIIISALFLTIAAFADRAALTSRGLRGASPWWMLLSPLAYLIFRGIALRKSGARHWAPVFAILGIAALSVLAAMFVILQLT
jgi:hypothetical protein